MLYLIKKNEVDIYNIPIAEITHQYLEYLDLMKMLDLDIAGEFIEMVATLMLIKVRLLLPGEQVQEDEEYQDPRSQLVAQLLEYKKFKDASFNLGAMESDRRKYFSRRNVPESSLESSSNQGEYLEDASLFDLLTAFKVALDNIPKVTVHEVSVIKVTLEKQVDYLFSQFGDRAYALFREICRPIKTKLELIVTFMAVLDLIRLKFLAAKQSDIFGEIRLVVLQPLSMEKYFEIRDQELLPETVNNKQDLE